MLQMIIEKKKDEKDDDPINKAILRSLEPEMKIILKK